MGNEPDPSPRVLVVDDEPETCVLLRAFLEAEGIQVLGTATGGKEACAMVDLLSPDVVLMDVRMPGMNGIEATRQIKATHPEVEVIILTFYGAQDWNGAPEQSGAYCFLVKGCPPYMIVDQVKMAAAHGALGQRAQSPPTRKTRPA